MVSYVLNKRMSVSIPEETRQHILGVAKEMGYAPHASARRLRTNKTLTIAGVIPDITNPFYPEFQRGIQDVAEQQGYDLITYNTDGDEIKERKALQSLREGRVDGIVGVFFHVTAKELMPLLQVGVPIVRLEPQPKSISELPLDNLYVDIGAACYDAVSHLITKGYTRIAHIAGDGRTGALRTESYRRALRDHQLTVDEQLIRNGFFTEAGGYAAMQALLDQPVLPDAIFAANDLMAHGVILALRQANLQIPNDVAVVGFDDIPASRLINPGLTTVTQHQRQLGRRAAEMLLARLTGVAPEMGRCEEMPYEIIERESA